LDDLGYGAILHPEQYRISDLSTLFLFKLGLMLSFAAPVFWTIPTLGIMPGLVEFVLSAAPAERNPKSQFILFLFF